MGHKASFYHGSMDPKQRAYIQKQWSKDEINIICATVAFGMGILFYFENMGKVFFIIIMKHEVKLKVNSFPLIGF